jgi:hypothetical protein
MTMEMGVIVHLVALYAITMLAAWYIIRSYGIKRPPSEEVRFVLQEGQTILGVFHTKRTIYFCIANDAMDEKSYE